ncbi:MAG: hypothetical protein BWY89_00422 [Bacteroidetes bacterium ADurb.BinA012]|nr:MAG: hypothetical protein BWY89_00422 [Bacteroidetes bacterium ADurb.BinA012]
MPGQTAVVGEEGPEMLVPAGNGFHVIPNGIFRAMGGMRMLAAGTMNIPIMPIPEEFRKRRIEIPKLEIARRKSDVPDEDIPPKPLTANQQIALASGQFGMVIGKTVKGLSQFATRLLIAQHVFRVVASTSEVFAKTQNMASRGFGQLINMVFLPLIPIGAAMLSIFVGVAKAIRPLFMALKELVKPHAFVIAIATMGVLALIFVKVMTDFIAQIRIASQALSVLAAMAPEEPPSPPGLIKRAWAKVRGNKPPAPAPVPPTMGFSYDTNEQEELIAAGIFDDEDEEEARPRPLITRLRAGGIVPGFGSGDIVPTLLEPGELVVPKSVVKGFERRADGGVSGSIGGFGDWFKGAAESFAGITGSAMGTVLGDPAVQDIFSGLSIVSKTIGAVLAPIAGVGLAIGAIKGGMGMLSRAFVKGQQAQIETAISVGKSQRTLLSLISIEGFGIIALLGLGLAVLNSILHAMPVATVPGVEGKGMLDILKDLFKSIWEAIKEGARSLFEWLKEKASGVWEWIKEKAAGIWERINEKAGGLWEFIKTKFGEVVEAIKAFIPKPVEAAKGVIDTVVNAGKKVAEVGDKFLGKGGTAALVGSAGLGVFTGGAEYLRTGDTGAALATGGMTAAGAFAFAKLLARFPKLGPVAGVAGYFARDSMIRDGATIGKAIAGPLGEDMGGIAASLVNDITAGAVTGSSIGGPVGAAGGAILGPIILGFKDLFAMKEEADKLASGLNLTPEQANAGGHLTNQYGFLGSVAATAYNTGVDLQGAPAVVGAAVTGGIDTATRAISDALTKAGDVLSAVVATVTGVVDAVIATVTAWQESAAAAGDTVREAILGAFASLGEYLAGLPSAIMEIIDRYLSGLPGIGGLFNSAKGALNIPSMASGGDILSDGVVNVHSGEAIIPARVNTNSNVRTDTTKTTITNHNTFVVQREDDRILFEKFKQMMVADSRRLVI